MQAPAASRPSHRASLLMHGVGRRLAVAGGLLALLWGAVAWALQEVAS